MYVINVHGLSNKALKEAGTEKRSRAFPDISWLLSRNPIPATIDNRIKTTILI
jgi:hypothetical protein